VHDSALRPHATTGLMHRNKIASYSIILDNGEQWGIVRPD